MSFQFDHWEIEDNYPVVFSRRRSFTKTPPLDAPYEALLVGGSLKKKKVRFSEKCSVILIPCRQEYSDAGIDLWYTFEDQLESKEQALEEIRQLMDYNPMLTTPMTLKYLYQPKYESTYAYHYEDNFFRDAKERLNILLIDENAYSAQATKASLKTVLQPFNQFVLSISHAESVTDAVEFLTTSATCAVSMLDVIIIHENIFVHPDEFEEDEDTLMTLLDKIHDVYAEKTILVGMMIADNKCANRMKDLGKRGRIDFVWKLPITMFITMLPIVLNERRSLAHSLPVFSSSLNNISPSPSHKSKH